MHWCLAAFPSPSSSSTAAAVTSRLPSEATHALSGQAGAQAAVGEISVDGQEEDLDDTLETDEEYLALVAKYNETVNKYGPGGGGLFMHRLGSLYVMVHRLFHYCLCSPNLLLLPLSLSLSLCVRGLRRNTI